MGSSATTVKSSSPASGDAAVPAAKQQAMPTGAFESVEAMIATDIPIELQASARELLRSVAGRVAVAEHFDAFCGQAFSKPEWAAAASPLIAELFDHDEDQLAELARIPDLVIEMGCGQATVTCMVASRWAARGETHRLSRLAESIVASHASKNACAVEVMLALAATLAVTRFSKAEQLLNAALPLVGDEHQEALADARRWLAAGRVVCSASQEERDFWDVRLRKPKTAWTWHSKEERAALDTLSERVSGSQDGVELYKALVPPCWWDMAVKCAQHQEKLAAAMMKQPLVKPEPAKPARANAEFATEDRQPQHADVFSHPKASLHARFVLGWICGAMATAITVLLLPTEMVHRVLSTFRSDGSRAISRQVSSAAVLSTAAGLPKTPVEKEAWREENLKRIATEMAQYSPQHAAAKTGGWADNEQVLSGQGEALPHDSPQHLKMLVWLHLDPPQEEEVRMNVAKLLLERMQGDAISLWEELMYPGSANAEEIKSVAKDALSSPSYQWSVEDRSRLQWLADGGAAAKSVSAAVSNPE